VITFRVALPTWLHHDAVRSATVSFFSPWRFVGSALTYDDDEGHLVGSHA